MARTEYAENTDNIRSFCVKMPESVDLFGEKIYSQEKKACIILVWFGKTCIILFFRK